MTSSFADSPTAIAKRLFAAIEAGDIAAVEELYAPTIVIWHNYDGVEQSLSENLRTLRWLTRNVTDLRYEEIRVLETPGGFVQQHVLRATGPGGVRLEIPACMVGTVNDGQITRIDEYLDSAHVRRLMARS
ncbi:nuclear transport factor 2 family protein [bacterium]|nr:nuclear transport factor 2 family protein [bacterium]